MVSLQREDVEELRSVAHIMRNPARSHEDRSTGTRLVFSLLDYCELCTAPVETGYTYCYPCKIAYDKFGDEMPLVMVPLVYAGATEQSKCDVYDYKGTPPSAWGTYRLSVVTKFFSKYHSGCIRKHTGVPLNTVVTVPSGKGRVPHPLDNFLRYFPEEMTTAAAEYIGPKRTNRATSIEPSNFVFSRTLAGEHVLILEDSWVQGNNALAMAIQAKRSGAENASILSIARFVDPRHALTATWMKTAAASIPYDPTFCPVTRGECP